LVRPNAGAFSYAVLCQILFTRFHVYRAWNASSPVRTTSQATIVISSTCLWSVAST
jgi:hypothetical protein